MKKQKHKERTRGEKQKLKIKMRKGERQKRHLWEVKRLLRRHYNEESRNTRRGGRVRSRRGTSVRQRGC